MSGVLSDLSPASNPAPTPSPNSASAPLPVPDTGGDGSYDTRDLEISVLQKYGYDVSKLTPATAPAGEGLHPAVTADGTELSQIDRMPPEQARAMAQALIASGVPEEKVNAALAAELGEAPIEPEPDDRSDEQREHDANHLMDREYEPSDYPSYDLILAFKEAGIANRAAPEGIAAWQNFLASANVPPPMGVGLVSQWLREARVYNAMSDGQKTLYRAEQRAQALIAAGGEERLQERGRLRDLALQHMLRTPGTASVIAEIVSSGVIYSNFTFSSLAAIGANLESWMQNMPADAPKGTRR